MSLSVQEIYHDVRKHGKLFSQTVVNALSIDVEDWFCVNNMSGTIRREDWEVCESRVVRNTDRILNILKQHYTKATFFILGWVAERFPDIVRKIDEEGHEIATHGYSHSLLPSLSPEEFEDDLAMSIEVLSRHTTQDIIGFRAPSFTITKKTLWALETLKKYGIKYDSSVFPVGFHPDYGVRESPLSPYQIADNLLEFPLGCFELIGRRFPCSGGGYFRAFPYLYTKFGINQCNKTGRPVVFYLHPWEIDDQQPRLKIPLSKRFRHYNNLHRTEDRLKQLLQDFRFTTIRKKLNL